MTGFRPIRSDNLPHWKTGEASSQLLLVRISSGELGSFSPTCAELGEGEETFNDACLVAYLRRVYANYKGIVRISLVPFVFVSRAQAVQLSSI